MGQYGKMTNRELLENYFDLSTQLLEIQQEFEGVVKEFENRGILYIDLKSPQIFVGNNGLGTLVSGTEIPKVEIPKAEFKVKKARNAAEPEGEGLRYLRPGSIVETVYAHLSTGGATARELQVVLSRDRRSINNALYVLQKKGLVANEDHYWFQTREGV